MLILTDGMRHSPKIDGEMRDENRKSQVADVTQRIATITWRDRDKHSLDDGIKPKSAAGCGIEQA